MSLVKKKAGPERSVRSPVTPFEIKGRVKLPGGEECEAVLIWNLSDQGMCVWLSDKLRAGSVVELEIIRPWDLSLSTEVRWCRSIPDRSGYIVGLLALDHLEELAEIHRAITRAAAGSTKVS
jgi:hypothetical protein